MDLAFEYAVKISQNPDLCLHVLKNVWMDYDHLKVINRITVIGSIFFCNELKVSFWVNLGLW